MIALCGCQSDMFTYVKEGKWNIVKTLLYYKYIAQDEEKYLAAQFLIDNMQYHFTTVRRVVNNDILDAWRCRTDSIYYSIVGGNHIDDFPWDSLKLRKQENRNLIDGDTLPDASVDFRILCDNKELSFGFLTEHIDNAFRVWRESPCARGLTFDEFCEYILPYRSVEGYGFHETGQLYNDWFGKYVWVDSMADMRTLVRYYNTAINNLRDLNGKTHRCQQSGVYDLYSRDFHDCIDIASYGCNILRACGIPVVVEYNICYRSLTSRHFHCSVYDKNHCKWYAFNPETMLPGDGDWSFSESANVYRLTFAAQKDTPSFLSAEGEYVPKPLSSPCIKDVTSKYRETFCITLPFKECTHNSLAYLATYNKQEGGVMPVTWGEIDKERGLVTFRNVITDLLYFPVYYPDEEYKPFGQPFMVHIVNGKPTMQSIESTTTDNVETCRVVLTRKFPRKTNMRTLAEQLVGGSIVASNYPDFRNARTLFVIDEPPQPALITYKLNRTGRYQFYRFQAPAKYPYANISMLEWLVPSSFGYKNTMNAFRAHIMYLHDTLNTMVEESLVRLLDEMGWDRMSWKTEYDGNMQTAPGAYPNITLRLCEPQIITHVRFSPKNADNGIHEGDSYELHCWNNGWESCGVVKAKYEFVEFENVPGKKLYWLENHSRGTEEMPFVIDGNGNQNFIYYN